MFAAFSRSFTRDQNPSVPVDVPRSEVAGLAELVSQFGGASFGGGIYRVIHGRDLHSWDNRVSSAFPQFWGRIACFGYDWLGRAFGVERGRVLNGRPSVLMFEPGTGDVLDTSQDLEAFHNQELVEFTDAALASDSYRRWRGSGGEAPRPSECIGYKLPLFLGGDDELGNLERSDIDVYWHLMGELLKGTKALPIGTRVDIGTP